MEASSVKSKRRWLIAGIVSGALLMLSPLMGVVFGMARAFHTLGESGIAKPEALAENVGTTLFSAASGVMLFPVGLIVFTVSLVFFFRLRASSPPPLSPPWRDDRAA